jgi:NAD(P)-dependent dehydrogenase (short-subunit alcohol dehydrogenase family)/acyl dehydratase/putative sterol carrier protein
MSNELRFDNKVVIVTGAGNGLGRSHALMFGARGARVVVNDLGSNIHGGGKSSAAADKVVEEIRALGGEAVANYDSVEEGEKIVKTALDAFGTVDIVINNAGILRDVSFHKMSKDDWDIIQRVHLNGSFSVSYAAWPILRDKQYGRIVMTTSAAGIYGNFGQANYSAAKLGILGLGQTLAIEGRSKNIHVNTIAPIAGSRLTETILPPEVIAALKPEYVSPLVLWLCHDSCQETGATFEVGAGYVGKLRWERTRGHVFRTSGAGFTPEDVARHWGKVTDFSQTEHPASVNEAMAGVMASLNKKSLGGNEFIDLDAASSDVIEVESSYTERDLALYALGVGAARDPLDPKELRFTYELGQDFQALPTYGVMPAMNAFLDLGKQGKMLKGLNYGLDRVLHGEQYLELYRPLPRSAKLKHTIRFKTAYDKKPHAVVILGVDTVDEAGEKLAYNEISVFVRGAGGWGGERGPSQEVNVPPSREPDAVIEEKTDPNQTLLYRLSGDWNPLHADPAFARAFGFDKPILHGLCSFGHVGRHVIKAFCDNDGRRFKSIKLRFAESVFPGETLVTRMWKEGDLRIVFETRVKERDKVVIRNAAIELYERIPETKAKPRAAAAAQPAASSEPGSADIFAGIGGYIAANPDLAGKIQTVFQFKLSNPESSWVIDLKNGAGACKAGTVEAPDVTLELEDRDFLDMCTGKADPNKLYFGGKLKVSGNIMASQKLSFLQKMDPKFVTDAMAARGGAAAPAPAAPTTASGHTSAAIFAAIGKHLSITKGLGDQIKTVFQFKLSEPDSAWVLDMKSGDGAVRQGTADAADVTLELADEDFVAMSTGKADPNKLYFGGKLKISGNIMASQKLAFLQKIDPKLLNETGAPAAAPTPAKPAAPKAAKPGQASAIFAALARKLEQDPKAINGLAGQVVQFRLRDPEGAWVIDLSGKTPKVEQSAAAKAAAVFGIADEDLVALAKGQAEVRDLYQRGRLRVDGDVRLARELGVLSKLI